LVEDTSKVHFLFVKFQKNRMFTNEHRRTQTLRPCPNWEKNRP